ncbi:hypothetical protein BRAO375_710015 [Bradyrhizobium sp. ORS 375]|nr:hypothetical protein BRAO375_710015 [Bradyrhizobium sp. ORS 375]
MCGHAARLTGFSRRKPARSDIQPRVEACTNYASFPFREWAQRAAKEIRRKMANLPMTQI